MLWSRPVVLEPPSARWLEEGPWESLWLGNTNKSHGGRKEKEEEEEKESSEEKKDPGRIPVFIRSLTGRTLTLLLSPLDDVSTLLSLVEGLVHIPRHLWYVRANGKPLPDLFMPHGLSRDEVVTMHGRLAGGAPPPRVPGGVVLPIVSAGEGAGQRDRPVFGVDALARILKP